MKIFSVLFLLSLSFFLPHHAQAADCGALGGKILLQVEGRGEAWYVYPNDCRRYALGRPGDSLNIFKKLSLKAKHDFISRTEIFPKNYSGLIIVDEENNQAYYINPNNQKKYSLNRPADIYDLMRAWGLGISNANLNKIAIGDFSNKIYLQNVPFSSQAPFGGWSDLRQEDGCEETSAMMAVYWAQNKTFTKTEALDKILEIADWEEKQYGIHADTSAADTAERIFKNYFKFKNVAVKKNPSLEDIKNEIKKGNVVIIPVNGQIIGNPNYTQPGPEKHMLVIKGYDSANKMFITNDPGTRRGESYKYKEDILYNSIRDYATSNGARVKNNEKAMIVVWK